MYIQQFEFRDATTGWHLAGARFEPFELLVGRCAAGKSKIIEALRRMQRFAVEAAFTPGAMEWTLDFEHDGTPFSWTGATELATGKSARIVRERLTRAGRVVADRSGDTITMGGTLASAAAGQSLAVPSHTGSLLTAITSDADVASATHGFRRMIHADREPVLSLRCARETQVSIEQAIRAIAATRTAIEDKLEPARTRSWNAFLEQAAATPSAARFILPIQEIVARLDKLAWLYALQELGASEREELETMFVRIYPFVGALRVFWAPHSAEGELLELSIREQGMDHWIPAPQMSVGMRRCMGLLMDAAFAPPGSVLLIDDLESDLGVEALPAVVKYLHTRTDCQVLATSRHPYIIDDVPVQSWRLVRRRGNEVCMDAVTGLPGYDVEPRHRAFLELLELAELEEQVS